MIVVFYVQICCSVEGLFSCRRILTQRGTFSQWGPVASFYLAIFEIFDSFLKIGLSMRGTDLRRMSASPLMKHFLTPGGCHEYVKGFCTLAHGPLVVLCDCTSRIGSFLNLIPLYTFLSKKVISVSYILAVNLIYLFQNSGSISLGAQRLFMCSFRFGKAV